jgi:hypothetical protein
VVKLPLFHCILVLRLNIPLETISFALVHDTAASVPSEAMPVVADDHTHAAEGSVVPVSAGRPSPSPSFPAMSSNATNAVAKEDLGDTSNGVKMDVLTKAVRAADNIAADFPEIKYVH